MFATPKGAAKLFLITVLGLIGLKMAVGAVTHSISIWAQAADSSLDFLAVVITFVTVGYAGKPADKEHPFGHGKVEGVAAGIQAVLIFIAAGLIIYSAVQRLISGTTIQVTEAGMGVMAVSIASSIFLSRHLFKVARATGSTILEANAHNIAADVYSAAGVLVGLVVVRFTGLEILDPIIALLMSLLILKAGFSVGRKAFGELIDIRLPQAEEDEIRSIVMAHGCRVAGFHDLRTRKAGSQRYIELHLVMPKDASVEETHRVCDRLEQGITDKLPSASVTVHVEPGDIECAQCSVMCTLRDKSS